MRRLLKWIAALAGIAAVFLVGALVVLYLILLRGLPIYDGKGQIAGLSATVEVVRDAEAIPHIRAETRTDAVAALGYAHAQERLWQMEMLRMAAQGRLSEMFGEATVNTDIFLRTIGLDRAARASVDALLPETLELLDAYSTGINAYIGRTPRRWSPSLPPEFLALGHSPEPWEPWHSVVAIKMMALTLDSNIKEEIRRMGLAARGFDPLAIEELVPVHRDERPSPLPDLRRLFGMGERGIRAAAVDQSDSDPVLEKLIDLTGQTASNNWVVSGSRTVSGKPILANDPHLGMTAPATFFLAHLSWNRNGTRKNIIGGSLPGTPAILAGRNDTVAWGLTTTNLDSQDIFVERLSPTDDNAYASPDGLLPFETADETIKVKGGKDITFTRRSSRHGPVLPDSYRSIKTILPERNVAALQWTALADDDTTLDAALAIFNVGNVNDYIGAMRRVVSPMQSMVVGDTSGNIAMIAPARVPVRSPENEINGRAPVPGWLARYDWQGYLAFDHLPILRNPENGAIGTANSRYLWPEYENHITYDWAEPFRHDRVQKLVISRQGKHDFASSIAAMGDVYSSAFVELRDILLLLVGSDVTIDSQVTKALQEWDGSMDASRPEPLIMAAWLREVHKALLADELKDQYQRFERVEATRLSNVLDRAVARDWCDNIETTGTETCSQIVRGSLSDALAVLSKEHGDDWTKWRWGKTHIAYGEHRPFANIAPLAGLFNVEVESAGGPYTLRRGQNEFHGNRPFANIQASVYRAVYDLAEPDKSKFIVFAGQSGHFLSPHYRSFTERWAAMEFVPMTTNPEDYEIGSLGTLMLEPDENALGSRDHGRP